MTMPGQQPGQPPGLGKMAEQLLGWPDPQKILGELQRLNNNIEMMHPDIHRLAQALEGISGADIRNLSASLGNIKAGDLLRLLNEFNQLSGHIYEKLWGKK